MSHYTRALMVALIGLLIGVAAVVLIGRELSGQAPAEVSALPAEAGLAADLPTPAAAAQPTWPEQPAQTGRDEAVSAGSDDTAESSQPQGPIQPAANMVMPAAPTLVPPTPEAGIAPVFVAPPAEVVPDQVVIQFDATASEAEKIAYIESIGGSIASTIDALNTVVVEVPAGVSAASLPESPVVEAAEPDYYATIQQVTAATNDPLYAQQWALPAINAPQAWLTLPAGAPLITVAVLDTGVCLSHPDLAGRIVAGYDFIAPGTTPEDEHGHGCHVAGIIAANANNGIGIAGVAPNARIMPVRVLDAGGSGSYSGIAQGIIWAANNGAQVINMSLGGSSDVSYLHDAVIYAKSRGVSVVAAAGNESTPYAIYPARYPEAIAVGSVDSNLQRSYFSNYGPDVDIWAPGGSIISTYLNNGYVGMSGTSMATPYVAGAVALEMGRGGTLVTNGGLLNFGSFSGPVAPTNDAFASAVTISALPFTASLDTSLATIAANDPMPSCGNGTNSNTVWYRYTPSAGGLVEIDTIGSAYNTVLSVWTGTVGSLTERACDNDSGAALGASRLSVNLTAGTNYYIEVADYDTAAGGGTMQLKVALSSEVVNDDFDAPVLIGQMPYSNMQNTATATLAADDPSLVACNR
ncbi:MAG: S8 family serine peptidase, partial [Anaerolineae bacterium]|nr:S8 family serine peptidase [Anaerolineae bacterium]